MTGVMDLKHILCEPMESKRTKPTLIMPPFDEDIPPMSHSRLNNNHATTSPMCRQRVQSEHYRKSPVLSWGYHYSQPCYHQDEVLIPPLTSSLSTNMIPSHSSSSFSSSSSTTSVYSPNSFMTPSASSSSTSSSSTSSSSPPITPTLLTPPLIHHDRRRYRSPSTSSSSQVDTEPSHTNRIQTRTPWTPMEDDLLQKGYEEGLSWAMISSTYLPHRSRGCCWGRFKTLQNKNLIDVKVQQQLRSAKLAWKTMEIANSTSLTCPRSSLTL